MTCRGCGLRAPRFLECVECGDPVCEDCRYYRPGGIDRPGGIYCIECAERLGDEEQEAAEAAERDDWEEDG